MSDAASRRTRWSSGSRCTCSCTTRTKAFCSCSARRSARRRTRTPVPSVSRCPARCRCSTSTPSSSPSRAALALELHGQPRSRSSRGRTTSIPICPRATRSRSSTSRSRPTERVDDRRRTRTARPIARAASRACTWRKTRASRFTTAIRAPPRSTSIAPACRSSRSSASPTCARPREAGAYLRALKQILEYLDVSDVEHGGGKPARGRERQRPSARRDEARHEDRSEEHELLLGRRARARGGVRAPGGALIESGGESRSRRCSGTRTAVRCDPRAPRKAATTTAISPSRIFRRCSSRPHGSSRCVHELPELPDARSERDSPTTYKLTPRRDRGAHGEPAARRLLRAVVRAGADAEGRCELGDSRRAAAAQCRRRRSPRSRAPDCARAAARDGARRHRESRRGERDLRDRERDG